MGEYIHTPNYIIFLPNCNIFWEKDALEWNHGNCFQDADNSTVFVAMCSQNAISCSTKRRVGLYSRTYPKVRLEIFISDIITSTKKGYRKAVPASYFDITKQIVFKVPSQEFPR